jgi:hypothetical protein
VEGEQTVGQMGGLKNNEGVLPPSRYFTIDDSGFTLGDLSGDDMRTLFQQPTYGAEGRKMGRPADQRQRAKDHLRALLILGPRRAVEIHTAAASLGITKNTLERAAKDLSIYKETHGSEWWWRLPTDLD